MSPVSAVEGSPAPSPGAPSASYVDVDVHLPVAGTLLDVFSYLPDTWRRRVGYLSDVPLSASPLSYTYLPGASVIGVADRPEVEATVSANAVAARAQALAPAGVDVAQVLAPIAAIHSVPSRYHGFGPALVQAVNDYVLERWITDERLRYALIVYPGDVDAAVAEIDRRVGDARVSSVWLPPTTARLGDPVWEPIYARAADAGLPVVSHPIGSALMSTPEMLLEGRMNAPVGAWRDLTSLVARGVFERFADLKIMFLECGVSWLDALVRRMDIAWRERSSSLAGLRRAPSEVLRQHVRVAFGPGDDDDPAAWQWEITSRLLVPLSDVLVYSARGNIVSLLSDWPEHARTKVTADNARTALRI